MNQGVTQRLGWKRTIVHSSQSTSHRYHLHLLYIHYKIMFDIHRRRLVMLELWLWQTHFERSLLRKTKHLKDMH